MTAATTVTAATAEPGQEQPPGRVSGTGRARASWDRLRRDPAAWVGAAIVTAFVVVAVAAPLIAPYEPAGSQWIRQITPSDVPGPSEEHLLGLDSFGSDLFTQLVYGARQSLVIGVVSTLLGLLAGTVLGVLSGGIGGWVDTAVMRVVDIMLSVPALLLAVSVAAMVGRSSTSVMVAIAVAQVPIFARLLRASLLSQRGQDYVLALRSLGLRERRIVVSHMLPNSLGPLLVQATLVLATAVIEVAALSFLGLGDPDPAVAEWGRMLVKAQERLQNDPQLALWPGVCIAVTALGFTLLGESLRQALDPRARR
ncbi:peptide/nickel transport system permease protein [Kineococcus xinjiangensis]|uniref:Peptide/nickel transport system permease protein n=1 Tax=Kineococcus xinjiangensis TaxID=512762 RepID=A0A2S6IPI1_9ACTN|nr:ABC transporter permease [Kineococcus xinjiangensis]PPK96040.1 peptide/nickel transport system permease protein [Kineococcus xinjiangensis]